MSSIHNFLPGKTSECVRCGLPYTNPIHEANPGGENDKKQEESLAVFEGKDPVEAVKQLNGKISHEMRNTVPLSIKANAIPGPDIRLGDGPARIGTWCLWCEYENPSRDELEAHMKTHIASGFPTPVTLNRLLQWLGAPVIADGDWLQVNVIVKPSSNIAEKIP